MTMATVSSELISQQLITATIHKEYGQSGGLTVRQWGKGLVVTSASQQAASAGLKRGYEILSMNNVDCSLLSEASAQKLLENDEMMTFLCKEMVVAPNTLVTAVLHKASVDSMVGLSLKVPAAGAPQAGQVVVATVKPGSLAQLHSDLRPGMIVKSINNLDCDGLNSKQASQLLSNAVGKITILAQTPPASTGTASAKSSSKASSDEHVTATVTLGKNRQYGDEFSVDDDDSSNPTSASPGLEFMNAQSRVDGSSMVLLKTISPHGAVFGTGLRVGMQVLKIQNLDCASSGATAEQVARLLDDCAAACYTSGEELMILARNSSTQRRAPGTLLTVVITKNSADSKLGVVLALRGNKLVVKKINDGTLGSTSELESDMIVHSINNVYMAGKSSTEAAQLLAQSEGLVTFLVQTPGTSATGEKFNPKQLVAATLYKTSMDQKVGMALQVQKERGLIVTKIAAGSLATNSDVKIGMKVLQINNVDCSNKTAGEAAQLLVNAPQGILTIIAQKPNMAPGTYVVASIQIPQDVAPHQQRPKVGLKFKSTDRSAFIITEIAPGSLAEGTDLQVGMLLKSVNNVDCADGKTIDKVLEMFQKPPASGILNILAMVPGAVAGGAPPAAVTELKTGRVDMFCMEAQEGSLDYDEKTGKITVTDIGASEMFLGTAIRSGMEILSINNVDAIVFSKAGLEMLLKSSTERLVFLAKQQPLPKNMLLTEVMTKHSASDPVGIGLRIVNGRILISSIKDGSLASLTKLMPGMELVSIDNEDCIGSNAFIVSKMLKEAVGTTTVVASTTNLESLAKGVGESSADISLVTAMLDKSDKEKRVGLTIVRRFNKLIITKIASDGLAAKSDLLVGMEVLSINNKDVTDMPSSEAAALLADAEGTLTVLAKRPNLPPGSYVTAAIAKESIDASLGIKLGVTRSGEVVVKSITPLSPASFTELEAGMLIKSINNVDTTKMAPRDVAILLRSPESPLTILAQTTTVVAMGRASYTSMRSLTSGRSLADDTIASSLSGSQKDWLDSSSHHMRAAADLEEIDESAEDDATPTPPPRRMVNKTPVPESPKAVDTITIVQGGRRTSLTVKNVVDC